MTSPMPKRNVAISNSHKDTNSNPMETLSRATLLNRMQLAIASMVRRLNLSTKPPIGMANNSHGSIDKAAMVAIQNGSLVKVVASSGAAVFKSPSVRLLDPLDSQSF